MYLRDHTQWMSTLQGSWKAAPDAQTQQANGRDSNRLDSGGATFSQSESGSGSQDEATTEAEMLAAAIAASLAGN